MISLPVAVLLLTSAATATEPPAAFGGLEPVRYAVGFRSEWGFDHGRTYDTTFKDGSRYAADGKAPRPVLINLWYPAAADDTAG